MYRRAGVALGVVLVATFAACRKDENEPAESPPQEASAAPEEPFWLRLQVSDGVRPPAPFFLRVDGDDSVLRNGSESLPLDLERSGDRLVVDFPIFGTSMELRTDGDEVEGTWFASFYFQRDFDVDGAVVAEPTAAARFPGEAPPAADVSGDWRVELEGFGVGPAVFRQQPDGALGGSLVPPDIGDTRYLSGRVSGRTLRASTFDGMHAYLIEARVAAHGDRMTGTWHAVGIGAWRFTATRGDKPGIEAVTRARVVEPETPLALPELDDPRYAGKPVIVDLFGTWCPACMDLTPALVDLERRYRDRGLEVLAIAYEPADDRRTEARLEAFKARYGVPWEIHRRVTDDFAPEMPEQVADVSGFPVTLFLRRDHTVAAVHTGFISPAAPEEHRALLEQFDRWTRAIVDAPAPE